MAEHRPIPVGVLYSKTGFTSHIESSQRLATLFAIEEINQAGGINGREVVPIIYDPQSDASTYRNLAERLVSVDGVKVIFGCYMSSTRKAVIPVVERRNCILFYATLYEGFEFSNNLIYTGAAPNQNSVQLADFMMSHFGARVYTVGSDYIYPYESNRIMTDLVMQRQGGPRHRMDAAGGRRQSGPPANVSPTGNYGPGARIHLPVPIGRAELVLLERGHGRIQ